MTATATLATPEAPTLSRAQLTNLAVERGIGTRREVRAIATDVLAGLVAQTSATPPRRRQPAKKSPAKAQPSKRTAPPASTEKPKPWSASEDRQVVKALSTKELQELLPGRSARAIGMRRWYLKDPERAAEAQRKSRAKAAPAKATKATPRKSTS